MFYAKRFSAYYFNSIRKLCFSILENSNNNNKRAEHTHTFALYDRVHTAVPFTSFPHMDILWFEPCALCDIVLTFFIGFLSFCRFLFSSSSIHGRVYFFPFFWFVLLPVCLFFFPQHRTLCTLDSYTLLHFILTQYFFRFGWIQSIPPSTIHHTHEEAQAKDEEISLFASSLFNVSSIFSYKILQTNQLNTAFEYSAFFTKQKRELNKNCLRFLYITLHYFHSFIHRCCYCHHHLKIIARIFSFR